MTAHPPTARPYQPQWLALGRQNPWIREADDPPFSLRSFAECGSDEELLDRLAHGNWCLGQAFYRDDLCLIQQEDGGDEWLAIHQNRIVDSVSFGRILREYGRSEAQAELDRVRAAVVTKDRGR
jgi:hypothetical protein